MGGRWRERGEEENMGRGVGEKDEGEEIEGIGDKGKGEGMGGETIQRGKMCAYSRSHAAIRGMCRVFPLQYVVSSQVITYEGFATLLPSVLY